MFKLIYMCKKIGKLSLSRLGYRKKPDRQRHPRLFRSESKQTIRFEDQVANLKIVFGLRKIDLVPIHARRELFASYDTTNSKLYMFIIKNVLLNCQKMLNIIVVFNLLDSCPPPKQAYRLNGKKAVILPPLLRKTSPRRACPP